MLSPSVTVIGVAGGGTVLFQERRYVLTGASIKGENTFIARERVRQGGLMFSDLKIVTGSSNSDLAKAICDHLGCQLTPTLATTFSDGELRIEIGDNVRGDDVFVVQPTCPPAPDASRR